MVGSNYLVNEQELRAEKTATRLYYFRSALM